MGWRAVIELLDKLRPHVEHAGRIFDSLSPDERSVLSNDPDILKAELDRLGFCRLGSGGTACWPLAIGQGAVAKIAGGAAGVRSHATRAAAGNCRRRHPDHALNRLSDIVERLSSGVNFFRLLEARPQLAQLLAKVLAHAPALADQLGRRPELFEGLFDASSFAMPPPADEFAHALGHAMVGHPYDVALDRARRLVNERRFALGVQLIDLMRDPLEVTEGYARVAEGALDGSWRSCTSENSRQRTANSPRASYSFSGLDASAAIR